MEYNKDESYRCLELAEGYLRKGDKEKALKLVQKSAKLYPSDRASSLSEKIERLSDSPSNGTMPPSNGDGVKHRHTDLDTKKPKYTKEQVNAVNRIKRCKDYYEILGVDQDVSEDTLKKKYRKLALLFHPDKNSAPGAIEAFKAIGNAFAVLSDDKKRREYDLYGEQEAAKGQREWDYSHGCEADMSPEEIFNMFFSGAMNGGTAHVFRRQRQSEESWTGLLFQISPILLLVLFSIISMMYASDNPYSFVQDGKYSYRRTTQNLQVPYFVKQDFNYYLAGLSRIEREIEEKYIDNLRKSCIKERMQKEELHNSGRSDPKRIDKLKLSSCIKLEEIYR